jgi:hypothetical protein
MINAAKLCHRRRYGLRFVLLISRRDFASWAGGCRSWRQSLLLLLEKDLLLDLLLLCDLWRCGNLGGLSVERDLGLLEVTTSIWKVKH